MTAGRKDFLWRSVVHLGGISLALNVLLFLTTTSWSGCETLSIMECNLDNILLSVTVVREPSSNPTTSLALRISLFSLLASAAFSLQPQHVTANMKALATTDS